MALVNTNSYVKFVKSTSAAFNALASKNPDTLYFVSDNATTGKLYLGPKLIGGADGGATSLSELADLAIDQLGANQILVYNSEDGKWENASISVLVDIMQGATANTAGRSGLVPVPAAGDQNKFLRGDGTWQQVLPTFSSVNSGDILTIDNNGSLEWDTFQSVASTNFYTKTEVDNAIANAAFLKRRVVSSVEAIDLTATDADKYIYMVRNSNSDGNNLYNEYIVVEDQTAQSGYRVELISSGTGSVDLTGYVTTGDLQTELSSLETNILQAVAGDYVPFTTYNPFVADYNDFVSDVGDLSQLVVFNSGDTLVEQVNELTDRLTWYELRNQ